MKEGMFVFIITFFSGWGWQALGKVANPATGKIEKNLDTAKHVIDMLDVLRDKTSGNVTEDEKKLMDAAIADLQLNYVHELNKGGKEEEGEKTDEGKAEEKTG